MTLLVQATIFLGAAILLVPLGRRFGLATVLGYLLTGVVLGPSGFNVAGNTEAVMHFAEYGVVMLLFLIGLELQPSRLWALRKPIFVLGGLQVLVTGAILMLVVWFIFGGKNSSLFGINLKSQLSTSFIIGFGFALSSTAFVLQLLSEKHQLASAHGRDAFAILLFQDIAVIPLLALLPLLSTSGLHDDGEGFNLVYFAKVISVFVGLVIASRFIVRPLFRLIVSSGANELLTAVALFFILGVALLMDQLNISMALGAFLTGVLLADSEYRHEIEASILPFKGLLLGLFFMSVGMSTNLNLIIAEPVLIIGGALGLMLFKFATLVSIARLMGNRVATSIRLGVALAQGGEFAFVVFNTAVSQKVLAPEIAEPLILIVTLSMALTPLAFLILEKFLEPQFAKAQPGREYDEIPSNEHQVIIAGFGRVGQIVGRILRIHKIEFTAVESDVRQVDFVRKFGNSVYYGNPNNPEILRAAGIAHAKLFILALDNVEESIATAKYISRTYPDVKIIARARDRTHYYRLREAGVDMVWRETYLSSLGMAHASLIALGFEEEDATESIEIFRDYDEELLERQQAVYNDESKIIESARASMVELEGLFDSDAREARKKASAEHHERTDRISVARRESNKGA
ncbi:monovalent cation:proton antiporter-2 (CPA2) family protein [Aquirhabdus parva]|uniref:Glutathione-regulated potassium-efflux system protein KefB n=1 Tax=Aquirhabdus parva TaxID=2283318 RepID=A0A345P3V3_9GAMM|nr:monovalent cation:proton antiporter-2 (CPA2) family protein [Aquirhabdus parva]AXI01962.1 glutathione-regulated potassium-efflux system protein KefB [Aquirhabdus parva]